MNRQYAAFFIDFEAFQHAEESFTVKELCILNASSPLKPLHYIYKPAVPWTLLASDRKRTYAYQEHALHRLSWSEGSEQYCKSCLMRDINELVACSTNPVFYAIGQQKLAFLQKELPELNIVEYGQTFKNLPLAPSHLTCCYRNHSREHCATLKCYRMYIDYCTSPAN